MTIELRDADTVDKFGGILVGLEQCITLRFGDDVQRDVRTAPCATD